MFFPVFPTLGVQNLFFPGRYLPVYTAVKTGYCPKPSNPACVTHYWNILVVICGISGSFLTLVSVTTVSYCIFLRAYRDMYRSLCIGGIPVCWCIVSALADSFQHSSMFMSRFLLKSDGDTPQNMHFNVLYRLCASFIMFIAKITFGQ